MIVDMLRNCYNTKMRFDPDSDTAIKVRWYWCDKNAKLLGFPTKFYSHNWDKDKRLPWQHLGEVKGVARPGTEGVNDSGNQGLEPCGTPQQFTNGVRESEIDPQHECRCKVKPLLLIDLLYDMIMNEFV